MIDPVTQTKLFLDFQEVIFVIINVLFALYGFIE